MKAQPEKILLVGPEDHHPGLAAAAAVLRDAGLEVVYIGRLPDDPAVLADEALQEDARVVVGIGVTPPALDGVITLCADPRTAVDLVRAALENGA